MVEEVDFQNVRHDQRVVTLTLQLIQHDDGMVTTWAVITLSGTLWKDTNPIKSRILGEGFRAFNCKIFYVVKFSNLFLFKIPILKVWKTQYSSCNHTWTDEALNIYRVCLFNSLIRNIFVYMDKYNFHEETNHNPCLVTINNIYRQFLSWLKVTHKNVFTLKSLVVTEFT